MSDPPGPQPALGVDSVQWSPAAGNRLTVRVTGRWLRRPAAAHGQPMLVVTADGRRHRFPAIPEPPSLTGTPPGVWRTTFSVPAWLAPHLSRRLALQIGGLTIPLPEAMSVNPVEEPAEPRERSAGPETGAGGPEPSEPPAELPSDEDIDAALDELAKAEARVRELEQETAELRQQAEESAPPSGAEAPPAPSLPGRPLHWVAGPPREDAGTPPAPGPATEPQTRAQSAEPHGLRREHQMLEARARRSTGVRPEATVGPRSPAEREAPTVPGGVAGQVASMETTLAELRAELAARLDSERGLTETVRTLRQELRERSEAEASVRAALASVQGSLDASIASQSLLERTLEQERARAAALALRVEELESELAASAAAREVSEARARTLEAELASAHGELERTRRSSQRDTAALGEAEALLAQVHKLAKEAHGQLAGARERVRRAEASREKLEREFAGYRARAARVHDAIDELRRQLAVVRASHELASGPAPSPAEPTFSGPPGEGPPEGVVEPRVSGGPPAEVEPERLSEALSRLRDAMPEADSTAVTRVGPPDVTTTPDAPAAPETPSVREPPAGAERPAELERPGSVGPWLERILRRLAADDPAAAGRVVVGVLPAQGLVVAQPTSYDLVLSDHDTVRVTVSEEGVLVERGGEPRDPARVQFRVQGDLAGLGRLVTSRAVRRRFGRGVARIKGERGAARALSELVGASLSLGDLHRAGARLEVPLALAVVTLLVDPGWTEGERFTIAFVTPGTDVPTGYLHVRDGHPLSVSDEAPLEPVATTVVCSSDSILAILAGERPEGVGVHGDERPLELLLAWVNRAQSD